MLDKLVNSDIQRNLTLTFGVALACVSITCEALFFIDFATDFGDKVLGAVLGAGLVGLQFCFVNMAVTEWKIHWVRSLPLWAGVFLLFMFSVAGTASYLESRYSTQLQSTLHESDAYKTQKQIVDGFLDESRRLRAVAAKQEAQGNYWIAGKNLQAANEAAKQAQQAQKELSTLQPTSQTSSAALGALAGERRWNIWWGIACLVDLAPLLCFAYTGKTETTKNTKTLLVKTTNLEAEEQTTQPETTTTEESETETQALSDTAKKVMTFLKAQDPNQLPPARDISVGVGYPKVKKALEELAHIGFVIFPEGSKRYQLNSDYV